MTKLRWEEIAEGCDFHAALVSLSGRRSTEMHTHDFAELMYVLSGQGSHPVNETSQVISEGDLLLIRPQDCHAIRPLPGENLVFANVAFPAEPWSEFLLAAGLRTASKEWMLADRPPAIGVPDRNRQYVAGVFHRILRSYYEKPTRLELIGFWVDASRLLMDKPQCSADTDHGPEWLVRACRAMYNERNLREGLPRMLVLSGVSNAHLSRTLKRYRGLSPTEFLNDLRLDRAAMLLSTTPREIIAISDDCGFGSLSYFYRLFHRRYGETPAQYRARSYATQPLRLDRNPPTPVLANGW